MEPGTGAGAGSQPAREREPQHDCLAFHPVSRLAMLCAGVAEGDLTASSPIPGPCGAARHVQREIGCAVAHRRRAARPSGDLVHTPRLCNSGGDRGLPADERSDESLAKLMRGVTVTVVSLKGNDVALPGLGSSGCRSRRCLPPGRE